MKNILENYSKFKNYEKLIILFGFFGLTPFIVGLIDTWFNYPNLLFTINLTKNYGVIIVIHNGALEVSETIPAGKDGWINRPRQLSIDEACPTCQ